jgi:hypothetical protein
MKCEQVQERLSEYLENLLDPEDYAAVQGHLSSCSHCQVEIQTLAQSIRAVENLAPVGPPPGFSQKVMTRIREEAEKPRLWQRLFLPMRVKIPIHAMALLLVAGFAVYLYQANRPMILMEQNKMPESVPSRSESMPREELQSAAGERQKEMDEIQPSVPGSDGELKRDENTAQELLSKRKMSDLKSAKPAAPAASALGSIQAVRYELIFTPKEPFNDIKTLSAKLEALVRQAGGEYIQPEQRTDGLKQNFRQESQIVWLVIPENRYGRFKTDLSSLGKIGSEIKAEAAPSEPRSSAEISAMIRIKLTIHSTENP